MSLRLLRLQLLMLDAVELENELLPLSTLNYYSVVGVDANVDSDILVLLLCPPFTVSNSKPISFESNEC